MIDHMQYGDGARFTHSSLDSALKRQILDDKSENSTLLRIREGLENRTNWQKSFYPEQEKMEITKNVLGGKLPKFDRFQDNFNGMGVTIHDTWACHITLKSLHIVRDRYNAILHYKIQDHFGLDGRDMLNPKFNHFRFFRIWFVLQRYNFFGFKPFLTNFSATIKISGKKNEN